MSADALRVAAVARDPRTQAVQITLSDGAVLVTAPHAPEADGLAAGDIVDGARLAALRAAAERKAVARRALRLLARRRYSRRRLTEKLLATDATAPSVEIVVQQLADQGLVDDRAFARAYCADQLARRPVGRAWLLRGLRAQGVGVDDARAGLDAVLPAAEEFALARAALRARPASTGGATAAARAVRFLVARGFPPAVARAAALRAREQGE